MKCARECGECLRGLGARVGEAVASQGGDGEAALAEALSVLQSHFLPGKSVPTRVATLMLRAVRKKFSVHDIFLHLKEEEHRRAAAAAGRLAAATPGGFLQAQLRELMLLALEGNRIDFFRDLEEVEAEWSCRRHGGDGEPALALDDSPMLEEDIFAARDSGEHVLILADNCGELPFDTMLIEGLAARGVKSIYAVKGEPSQNDLTRQDVRRFGARLPHLVHNGTDRVGTELDRVPDEFGSAWRDAGVIISKGMANLETLTEYPEELAGKSLYFMLVAKCAPVARYLGVERGKLVISHAARLCGGGAGRER